MSFAEWTFLLGTLAIAGPLLAHLLARPKYRRLPFAMLQFLQGGHVEVQSRRTLRNLLLLLFRCGIILFLAMLFAGPRVLRQPSPDQEQPVYFLGLDNSLSMTYCESKNPSYFHRMIQAATDYLRTASEEGIFHIYALASGTSRKNLGRREAMDYLQQIETVPLPLQVEDFLVEIRKDQRAHPQQKVSVLIISDFTPKTLEPFASVPEPVAVDDFRYLVMSPDHLLDNAALVEAKVQGYQHDKVQIAGVVANFGEVAQHRQVMAKWGDRVWPGPMIHLAAAEPQTKSALREGFSVEVPVEVSPEKEMFLPLELILSGSDGLREDDPYYLSIWLQPGRPLSVLLVGESSRELYLLKTALEVLLRVPAYNILSVQERFYSQFEVSVLSGVNVVVCVGLSDRLVSSWESLQSFVQQGGRMVFFLTPQIDSQTARAWEEAGLLSTHLQKFRAEPAYLPRAKPSLSPADALSPDGAALNRLQGYPLERLLFTGYYESEPIPEGTCLWQFQNGSGFLYYRPIGNGSTLLVNTSADDTLGNLFKSPVAIAFCQYLLGQPQEVGHFSFVCGERIILPATEPEMQRAQEQQVLVSTPSHQVREARVSESFLWPLVPPEIGWVKTVNHPKRYAGVNIPAGETDLTRASPELISERMNCVFSVCAGESRAKEEWAGLREYQPITNVFVYLLILLLFAEALLANRMKR